jgi:hypothetical protein
MEDSMQQAAARKERFKVINLLETMPTGAVKP